MVKGNNREDNHEEGEKGGEVGGGDGSNRQQFQNQLITRLQVDLEWVLSG